MKSRLSIFILASILVFLTFGQVRTLNAQPLQKDYLGMDYTKWLVFIPGNSSVQPFYISAKPVTNREYILYMVWTQNVYADYPEAFFDILPGNTEKIRIEGNYRPFGDSASFNKYLENSDPFLADYIFNPDYLDYPVIGISWEQANKFCHWLSDRYNEYSLIKMKYLSEDPYQRDENNFSSESFIMRQYEGTVNKPRQIHGDPNNSKGFEYIAYTLRPSFHIASRSELEISSTTPLSTPTKGLYNKFDRYTTDGSEFLKPFYKNFLPEKKGYIYFSSYDYDVVPFYLSSSNPKDIAIPETFTEWCLDSYLEKKGNSVMDIYTNYGYTGQSFSKIISNEDPDLSMAKDSLGILPFIITGENSNREIEIIRAQISMKNAAKTATPYIFDNKTKMIENRNGDIYTTFRYAVNAIRRPEKK